MEFLSMVQKLQLIYGLKIVLISCGSFYIAVGADAVTLNKELGLKLNCAKKGLCKVGVPKTAIDKYIKKLNEIGYAYVILDYQKDKNKIVKLYQHQGRDQEETSFNCDCENCSNRGYTKKTEYSEALEQFVKREFGEDFVW